MIGLIIRIFRQMKNDRRTLMLIMAAPLLILVLLNLLLGKNDYIPRIAVSRDVPALLQQNLAGQDVKLTTAASTAEGLELLKDDQVDAWITVGRDGIMVTMQKAGSAKAAAVTKVLRDALSVADPGAAIKITYLYGREDSTEFDSLGYVLLGVLSFFFVFIISGISLVRERQAGTLERIMAAPVRRFEVVAGFIGGYGFFAVIQSVLITLFCKYVLGMEFAGSVALAVLVMVLLAVTAVSAGALLSIFARNEFQVMQFIPVVIIPQIFFSGLIPIDMLPGGLGILAWIMPVYYGCTALESVMVQGAGFIEIRFPLAMLLLFIAVLFSLNVAALRRNSA